MQTIPEQGSRRFALITLLETGPAVPALRAERAFDSRTGHLESCIIRWTVAYNFALCIPFSPLEYKRKRIFAAPGCGGHELSISAPMISDSKMREFLEPANLAASLSAAHVSTAGPIVRPTLHDEVVERLRTLIVEGDLLPESRIPELVICRQLGISRTPLREALKVLAAEGLVTLVPHQGAVVTKLDAELVDYMFQVLESLEPLAGELACSHMPQPAIDEVCRWHDQMIGHYKRRQRGEFFHLNRRIHEAIVKGCGNPILIGVYQGLGSRVRYARYMENLSAESWKQAVQEHREIRDALAARNGKRLARILKQHLRNKREYVKSALTAAQ
jgi:DNA-binding GntR family transcriptional regulator